MQSVKRIALGTAQFGSAYGIANKSGQVDRSEVDRILRLARDCGIDTIDTAIAYGVSEEVLGHCGVDHFKVVTKLPKIPYGLLDAHSWVSTQITESLYRLRVESLYAVLLHRSQDLIEKHGVFLINALQKLKASGVVQKVGISVYDPCELEQVEPLMDVDIVQGPLNVFDRRLQETGYLRKLRAKGVEIHTRSVFLQGLLLAERKEIPQEFERWSDLWDTWHKKLNDAKVTPAVACLSYPLSLTEIDKVVVGVDTEMHLEEIIKATSESISHSPLSLPFCEDSELINPSFWNRP